MKRVLIANRGEIAVRIARTCQALGIAVTAVYSEADRTALHVREVAAMPNGRVVLVGPAAAAESYLATDAILDAARRTRADAIHPGYGFLSENTAFSRSVTDAGLVWIGPPPEAIEAMGSKIAARAAMKAAGVPIVPGLDDLPDDPAELERQAEALGFPVLVKASAGGGGKGMRAVHAPSELTAAIAGARREAAAAFADGTVYLEKLLARPRHIEIQVFGDRYGGAVHLFERECSIQRRHQKVLEETPSPFLDAALRAQMAEAAVAACRAVGYVGAGTIELMVAPDRSFYFLEMNTRLQVEHPVTELLVGQDLVAAQIAVAQGGRLPWTQDQLRARGHAIEVRLYAEDPSQGFVPSSGTLVRYRPPEGPGIRHDGGVAEGDEVSTHYDPMLAKLIAWGANRDEAVGRLTTALDRFEIHGVRTNLDFLGQLVRHPAFLAGDTHTGFIAEHFGQSAPPREPADDEMLVAIALAERLGAPAGARGVVGASGAAGAGDRDDDHVSPWRTLGTWRGCT